MERASNAELDFLLILILAASLLPCSSAQEQDLKEAKITTILGRKMNAVCECGVIDQKCPDGCGKVCLVILVMGVPKGICV
ncbi:hypothetical protein K7X08_002356 [Anisodus acutangulus]|uniref:Uncharacterized protein n=1 Tax=Anisodus acutangulus TaxID=402998 RepID=A0A9Q1LRE2_9SOLA|nr:hypothetical protein K7X08_002356 [Anisodus acutangulus]